MRCLSGLAVLALGGCVVYERDPLPRPAEPPLSANEALRLVAAGVSEAVIREAVDLRGVEPLDADALAALKKAGASDPLLQKMILAVRTPPTEEDVVYVEPYPYYYSGYYPWYPSLGFGFGFSSRHYYGRPARGVRIYR